MAETYQSLAHSRWDCKYHVVFVPKRRRKALFGNIRQKLGAIDRKSTRLNSSHIQKSRMPSSA